MPEKSAPQYQLETRAIEIAAAASARADHSEQRLSTHEAGCTARQRQIIEMIDKLGGRIDALYGMGQKAQWVLIAILISAVGYFLVHNGLPGDGLKH